MLLSRREVPSSTGVRRSKIAELDHRVAARSRQAALHALAANGAVPLAATAG